MTNAVLVAKRRARAYMGKKVKCMLRDIAEPTHTNSGSIISLIENNMVRMLGEDDMTKAQVNATIMKLILVL